MVFGITAWVCSVRGQGLGLRGSGLKVVGLGGRAKGPGLKEAGDPPEIGQSPLKNAS